MITFDNLIFQNPELLLLHGYSQFNFFTMPVFFKKTKRRDLKNEGAFKWYCVLRRIKRARTKDVAKLASVTTTVNPQEIELAILRYFDIIADLLLDGRTVEIEGFGTFRMTANSEGADTKEELNAGYIKKGNIRFIPAKEFKSHISKMEYIDAEEFSG